METATATELKAFTAGYDECLNWSEPDAVDYWDTDAEAEGHADCAAFVAAELADLRAAVAAGRPWDHLGHDFWLTRNHHGAGFWDRGLGELGDRLTAAAHVYGEVDIDRGEEEDDEDDE